MNNLYYLYYVGITYIYYFTINIRLKERKIKEDYFIYEVEPNKNVIIGGIKNE